MTEVYTLVIRNATNILLFRNIYRMIKSTLIEVNMKDAKTIKANQAKASYDERMKADGFIKSCYWINPKDAGAFSRKAEISREKTYKGIK